MELLPSSRWPAPRVDCPFPSGCASPGKSIHAGAELWVSPRVVFNASTSQSAAATINAAGKIKTPFCKFPPKESASRPTISGDHMSPKRWIVKMETAMALARRFTGAVARMSVLTGPVGRNRENIAPARIRLRGPRPRPGRDVEEMDRTRRTMTARIKADINCLGRFHLDWRMRDLDQWCSVARKSFGEIVSFRNSGRVEAWE